MSPAKDIVDMSKLTQRELLILLNANVQRLNNTVECLSQNNTDLATRITKVETRAKTISATWGVASVIIATIINSIKLFK